MFHYTLRDDDSSVIDQSDGEPMTFLYGHGQIVPGLERELTGRKAGDELQVRIASEEELEHQHVHGPGGHHH